MYLFQVRSSRSVAGSFGGRSSASTETPHDTATRVCDNRLRAIRVWATHGEGTRGRNVMFLIEDLSRHLVHQRLQADIGLRWFDELMAMVRDIDLDYPESLRVIYRHIGREFPGAVLATPKSRWARMALDPDTRPDWWQTI